MKHLKDFFLLLMQLTSNQKPQNILSHKWNPSLKAFCWIIFLHHIQNNKTILISYKNIHVDEI
jgi:hypothetical protein